jgi:hypothetical protein
MESLAAVSLAGNVVNFIEFGLDIVSKAKEMRRTHNGVLAGHNDLEVATRDLLLIQTQMERCLAATSAASDMGQPDRDLIRLMESSNALARSLLERLNMAKSIGGLRRWKSIRQALKSVSSKQEIDDVARRLSDFRSQFQTRILSTLVTKLDQATESTKTQAASYETLKTMLEAVGMEFKTVKASIGNLEHKIGHDLGGRAGSDQYLQHHSVLNLARKGLISILHDPDEHLRDKTTEIEDVILASLEYQSMDERREEIKPAHAKTFEWIINSSVDDPDVKWDDFMEWLTASDALYWIKGKAASGKSTLMKFLSRHHAVNSRIHVWGDGMDVLKADFFFYSLGTGLQKSQTGLLLSLLHQLLGQKREAIRLCLPDLWDRVSHLLESNTTGMGKSRAKAGCDWTFAKLSSVFEVLVPFLAKSNKLVLFIDGLDEFDGDHTEIAEMFNRYSTMHRHHIKICVSSRPLVPFEESFEGCKGLRLQDLTSTDIRTYISDKLHDHRRFRTLTRETSDAAEALIDNVAEKSSGVFLWVFLVVKSLCSGLTNDDSIEDLEVRLRALPPELDALYGAMLRSIEPPFYKGQASQLLQIVFQHKQPMSSLALSFADEKDHTKAVRAPVKPLSDVERTERVAKLSRRLHSRCRGLVEVHSYKHGCEPGPGSVDSPFVWDEIRFLHLSVRDYLEQPHVWSEIISWTKDLDFDVNLACARSHLLRVKTTAHYHGWGRQIRCLLDEAIRSVAKAELSTGHAHVELVDEINKLGKGLLPSDREHEWVGDDQGTHGTFCSQTCSCLNISFFEYVIMHGLTNYVKVSRYSGSETIQKRGAELLDIATGLSLSLVDESKNCWNGYVAAAPEGDKRKYVKTRQGIFLVDEADKDAVQRSQADQRPILPMVKLFLVNGVNPNEKREGSTHWLDLISHIESVKAAREDLPAVWADICTLYVVFNADLDAVPSQSKTMPHTDTAEARLRALFQDLPLGAELFREMSRWRLRHRKRPLSRPDQPLADRITHADTKEIDQDLDRPRKRRRGRGRPRQ